LTVLEKQLVLAFGRENPQDRLDLGRSSQRLDRISSKRIMENGLHRLRQGTDIDLAFAGSLSHLAVSRPGDDLVIDRHLAVSLVNPGRQGYCHGLLSGPESGKRNRCQSKQNQTDCETQQPMDGAAAFLPAFRLGQFAGQDLSITFLHDHHFSRTCT